MIVAWVLGHGGLLGSALIRSLPLEGTLIFYPAECFAWHCETTLAAQLAAAVESFAACVDDADSWEIYWACGIGFMGSSEADLIPERESLVHLIRLIKASSALMAKPGAFAFASSAGGIYAASKSREINEYTQPSPLSAYGREKLRQEELLKTFADDKRTVLLARISTLYGPGQSLGKKQGLITHMARCLVRNQTIQIYVPLDTIRDYITADDAAREIISALRFTWRSQNCVAKIIASEQPTTIAQISSAFKMIARRKPRIVTSSSKMSGLYSRCVRFRSVVEPINQHSARTNLLVGVAQVLAAEYAAFISSS